METSDEILLAEDVEGMRNLVITMRYIDRVGHSMVQATDGKKPDQNQILIQSLPSVLPAFENHPPHRHDDVEPVAE